MDGSHARFISSLADEYSMFCFVVYNSEEESAVFVYYVKHHFQFNNNDCMHEFMGIFVAFRLCYKHLASIYISTNMYTLHCSLHICSLSIFSMYSEKIEWISSVYWSAVAFVLSIALCLFLCRCYCTQISYKWFSCFLVFKPNQVY